MAERMYDRTWVEIENLLGRADTEIMIQRQHYEERRNSKDKDGCRRALAKYARAKGVALTLRWVLNEAGASNPLYGDPRPREDYLRP